MNRRAVSMVILFFVVATIVLCVLSLYYMLTEEKKIDKTFQNSDFIDKTYFKRMQLDYTLQGIFDEVSEDFEFSDNKGVLISGFKEELDNYESSDGNYVVEGLEWVEEQLIEENIELTEEKIVLNLKLNVESSEVSSEYRFVKVDYNYENSFEKNFS
jgi:hypothetical protein